MVLVVAISGSPSRDSKTARLANFVIDRLSRDGVRTSHLAVRTLPAAELLAADTSDRQVAEAIASVAAADGLVLATPTYKAAYSGLLKAFLDLLPQFAFAGKAVLPLATGGTLAHVLALDYALRPVLQSLGARHVVQSFFVLEKYLTVTQGELTMAPECELPLGMIVDEFAVALRGGIPSRVGGGLPVTARLVAASPA